MLDVVLATAVLMIVLVGVSSSLGTQLLSVGSSTSQVVAESILNKSMEEVRAIEPSIVQQGLYASDSLCSDTKYIKWTGSGSCGSPGGTYTFVPTGEKIPVSATSSNQVPFTPTHIQTVPPIDGIKYSVAAYPSQYNGTPALQGLMRVTIVVSWRGVAQLGGVNSITAQTMVYPTICVSAPNNPFPGPCQDFYYGDSEVGDGGAITVTNEVSGLTWTFDNLQAIVPQAFSAMQVEQSTTVSGCAETSGGQITVAGTPQVTTPENRACSEADNNPGTSNGPYQTNSASQSSQIYNLSGVLANELGITTDVSDSVTTTSALSASASHLCDDLSGTAQATNLPCGSGAAQASSGLGINASLVSGALGSLGAAPLVSFNTGATVEKSFAARFNQGSSTSYCDTSGSSGGNGCIHAGAERSFGTIELGGLPSGLIGGLLNVAPLNWGVGSGGSLPCPAGNYLVALVGYSDQVSAESGLDAAAPSATNVSGGSGYICSWSGSNYVPTTFTLGAVSQPITSVVSSNTPLTFNGGAVSVSLKSNLQIGTATTSQSTAGGCKSSPCTANAQISSPIEGNFELTILVSGVTLADLNISVDLGQLIASTSYQEEVPAS